MFPGGVRSTRCILAISSAIVSCAFAASPLTNVSSASLSAVAIAAKGSRVAKHLPGLVFVKVCDKDGDDLLGVEVGPQVAVYQHQLTINFSGDDGVGVPHRGEDGLEGVALGLGVATPILRIRNQCSRLNILKAGDPVTESHAGIIANLRLRR